MLRVVVPCPASSFNNSPWHLILSDLSNASCQTHTTWLSRCMHLNRNTSCQIQSQMAQLKTLFLTSILTRGLRYLWAHVHSMPHEALTRWQVSLLSQRDRLILRPNLRMEQRHHSHCHEVEQRSSLQIHYKLALCHYLHMFSTECARCREKPCKQTCTTRQGNRWLSCVKASDYPWRTCDDCSEDNDLSQEPKNRALLKKCSFQIFSGQSRSCAWVEPQIFLAKAAVALWSRRRSGRVAWRLVRPKCSLTLGKAYVS